MLGIDPNPAAISVANAHLMLTQDSSEIKDRVKYQCCSLEDLITMSTDPIPTNTDPDPTNTDSDSTNTDFDCVVASEVIEHVADVELFVNQLSQVTKVDLDLFCMLIKFQFLFLFLSLVDQLYFPLLIVPYPLYCSLKWQQSICSIFSPRGHTTGTSL